MRKRLFAMLGASCGVLYLVSSALAQVAPNRSAADFTQPKWRQALLGLPSQPPADTRPQDVYRVERDLRSAMPYFAAARPGDYEANRELVRRVAVYLAGLQVLSQDREMRRAIGRVQHTMGSLPYYPLVAPLESGVQSPPPEPPPVYAEPESRPPFSMAAPSLPPLQGTAKASADSLSARYEGAAARAAAAWQSGEKLRLSLASQGAVLNSQTAADLARLEVYFNSASKDLVAQNWEAAQTELERAEYTTERVFKVIGR